MPELIAISAEDAASPDATNRVLVTFTNDHDISGAKFDVVDVSAEQLFVAVAYLTRIANQLLDARVMQSAAGKAQMDAIRNALAKERN